MIAPKRSRQYGIIQMFLENGKIVFHPDGEEPIAKIIPKLFQVYGVGPEDSRTPPAFRFALKLVKKLGWKPVMPPRFVWCGWGWELRIWRIK